MSRSGFVSENVVGSRAGVGLSAVSTCSVNLSLDSSFPSRAHELSKAWDGFNWSSAWVGYQAVLLTRDIHI